ncbi:hypothetical protein ES332_D01G124300v1 [Gossypium tomentosum]|uniref:Uncharacterized protein n=1 Tax=Gossypium tomentosum TaxID=34277 RepID=A0A5D2M887_GOSTO|nr:hypothetical protein ES332_D01G124300v1 [Gossypium tomentosum]
MKKKKIKIKRMFSSLRRSINRPLESPLAFARSTPISPEEKKASSALFTCMWRPYGNVEGGVRAVVHVGGCGCGALNT